MKLMSPHLSLSLALLIGSAATLLSQSTVILPVEFRQSATRFNFQSQRGVPISTVTNEPPGSDGRMSVTNESAGSSLLPTAFQFSGYVAFGAIPGLTSNAWQVASNSALLQGTNAFSGPVA